MHSSYLSCNAKRLIEGRSNFLCIECFFFWASSLFFASSFSAGSPCSAHSNLTLAESMSFLEEGWPLDDGDAVAAEGPEPGHALRRLWLPHLTCGPIAQTAGMTGGPTGVAFFIQPACY